MYVTVEKLYVLEACLARAWRVLNDSGASWEEMHWAQEVVGWASERVGAIHEELFPDADREALHQYAYSEVDKLLGENKR